MKFDKYLLSTVAALSLVWSLRSEAHTRFEAIQESTNLASFTTAVLHPVLENPLWLAAAIALMLAFYLLARRQFISAVRRKVSAGRSESTAK